ncbi:unnamed protein product [Arctogadus glacialis]
MEEKEIVAVRGLVLPQRDSVGFNSAMVEKKLRERNFGFDSLKSRLYRDMEEKGIIARDCLLLGSLAAGLRRRCPGRWPRAGDVKFVRVFKIYINDQIQRKKQ